MKPYHEHINLNQEASILAFNYSKKNFETPYHFHPQHELTYIEESRGAKFIGDFVGNYEPGELVLVRSQLPHCWKNHQGQTEYSKSTVIQWNPSIFTQVPELAPVFDMLTRASKGILFEKSEVNHVIPRVRALPGLTGHQLYLELLAVLTLLAQCTHHTLSAASYIEDSTFEYSNRMAKIHDFVQGQYQRKVYLREAAEIVNLTEQSFSRFFSKAMGRPFFTFLNEYRINMACRMLLDTDWSVSEIGFRCGYESLPFFHKQFNKFKEVTPSKYRKLLKV